MFGAGIGSQLFQSRSSEIHQKDLNSSAWGPASYRSSVIGGFDDDIHISKSRTSVVPGNLYRLLY